MYKLPKEQRDLLISQMPLVELQSTLSTYDDNDALSHEGHRKRMKKYTSSKRLRVEESNILFKCDWATVEPYWKERCKPNTVKTYRTAHQSFMEYATTTLRPIEHFPHTAFLNLLNTPQRVKEMIEAMNCALSTKISKVKYLLTLIDRYPGIDNHVQAYAVGKLKDFYEYLLLLEMEQNTANDAETPTQITYDELLERSEKEFGPLSDEYIFIRTMLEIPCRGDDLATMGVYGDEVTAKAQGAENYIVLPSDHTKCASYNLHNFKTMSFTSRYITSDDLSMELTALFREKLGHITTDEQPYNLFPKTSQLLTKLIKNIKDQLNVPLSINILRHTLQRQAKDTLSPEEYVSYNRKMLHSLQVGEEVYLK